MVKCLFEFKCVHRIFKFFKLEKQILWAKKYKNFLLENFLFSKFHKEELSSFSVQFLASTASFLLTFLSPFFLIIDRYKLIERICFPLKHLNYLLKFSKLFVKKNIRFDLTLWWFKYSWTPIFRTPKRPTK